MTQNSTETQRFLVENFLCFPAALAYRGARASPTRLLDHRPGRTSLNPRATCQALTLAELVIAVAILVTVMTSTMLIFRAISRAWQSGQLRTERYQQARLLFDLFARELSSCIVADRYPFIGHKTTATPGSSAPPSEPLKSGSVHDEVFFVGTLPGRMGMVERGYWVNELGELMCHDEEPADGEYATTGLDEPCGSEVIAFDVTYFDGTTWLIQWDGQPAGAQAGRVPKALHIALTIGKRNGEPFETVIFLPTS